MIGTSKGRGQFGCSQQKTVSTTPSTRMTNYPRIHSYHKYQSLMKYITSFITDFKLHIVELKQLIYQLIGIDITEYFGDYSKGYADCESCQVQYMMYSCRKAREDMVRIISIIRGLAKSKPLFHLMCPLDGYDSANIEKDSKNLWKHSYSQNFKNIGKDKKNNWSVSPQQIKAQMGFLTFREIKSHPKQLRRWQKDFKLQQQQEQIDRVSFGGQSCLNSRQERGIDFSQRRNLQYSVEDSIEENIEGEDDESMAEAMQDGQSYFKRAFLLIGLIKQQMSKYTKAKYSCQQQICKNNLICGTIDQKSTQCKTFCNILDSPQNTYRQKLDPEVQKWTIPLN